MNTSVASDIRFLTRPEGRIAYTVTGDGPLIVAVPGMGDTRSVYRELLDPLVAAGFRVAVTDVRGHGDSDTAFRSFGDEQTAADILALIEELGGPALVIGNSYAGSAAVIAASQRPDAVAGVVLLAPFLREGSSRFALSMQRVMYRVLFAPLWGAAVWVGYYKSPLNRGRQAPWLDEHLAELRAAYSDRTRLSQLRKLMLTLDHGVVEQYLDGFRSPALVMIGAVDPDYKDPAAELAYIGERLSAETALVDDAAHYPQAQRADVVVPRVLAFASGLRSVEGSGWRSARA